MSGNTCERNGSYGVVIEAGDTQRSYPRRFIQTLTVDLEGNTFVDNGRAPALFTFNYWIPSVFLGYFFHKFAEDSDYTVTDADGVLAGFDYDDPVADPISRTVLNNTLTVNGVAMPHGKSITPFR